MAAWLPPPPLVGLVVRGLVWGAIILGPRIVDLSDAFSVWRYKRSRALRRRAAALRHSSRTAQAGRRARQADGV